jgi:hypothetical protein
MPITAAGQQAVKNGGMGLSTLEGQNEQVSTAYSKCIRINGNLRCHYGPAISKRAVYLPDD